MTYLDVPSEMSRLARVAKSAALTVTRGPIRSTNARRMVNLMVRRQLVKRQHVTKAQGKRCSRAILVSRAAAKGSQQVKIARRLATRVTWVLRKLTNAHRQGSRATPWTASLRLAMLATPSPTAAWATAHRPWHQDDHVPSPAMKDTRAKVKRRVLRAP